MTTYFSGNNIRGQVNIGKTASLLLGDKVEFQDVNNTGGPGFNTRYSGMTSIARWVKNTSGGTLVPGHSVTYKTNKFGTELGAQSAADVSFHGIIDPDIQTATVANNDEFLLFIEGPCLAIVSAAITVDEITSSGSGKVKGVATTEVPSAYALEAGDAKADTNTMRVYLLCESNIELA